MLVIELIEKVRQLSKGNANIPVRTYYTLDGQRKEYRIIEKKSVTAKEFIELLDRKMTQRVDKKEEKLTTLKFLPLLPISNGFQVLRHENTYLKDKTIIIELV